jgi:adenosylcobinamide-GDP ribazoletransferase
MRVLRALSVAFSFLTRLPVRTGEVAAEDLGSSLVFFPLVGAALGIVQVLAGQALHLVLSENLCGVLLVALGALLTGGLHLDGVADLFDGLGGARSDRQRALDIMRDSRIGAHGAVALVLVLLGKVFACAELLQRQTPWPLFVAPVCARLLAVALIARLPYARSSGLGLAMHQNARIVHLLAALVLTAVLLAVVPADSAQWLPLLIVITCVALAALLVSRALGGLTGDAYGAAIEICELCILATL